MSIKMRRRAYIDFVGTNVVYINTLFKVPKRFELSLADNEKYIDLISLCKSKNKLPVLDENTPPYIAYISVDAPHEEGKESNEKDARFILRVFVRKRADHVEEIGRLEKGSAEFNVTLIED